MAGVELEKYAIGHEMSNHQSEKQTLEAQHKAGDPLGESHRYLQLCSFTFLHCTIFTLDRLRPWSLEAVPKSQSCI